MNTADWEEAVLDSSLALLALQAKAASLEDRNRDLHSENERLSDNVERLEDELADLREAQRRSLREKNTRRRTPPRTNTHASTSSTHAKGGTPSTSTNQNQTPVQSTSSREKAKESTSVTFRASQSSTAQDLFDSNNGWRIPESEWVLTPETSDATTLDSPDDSRFRSYAAAVRESPDSNPDDPWKWPSTKLGDKSKDSVAAQESPNSNLDDPWKWPSTSFSEKSKDNDNTNGLNTYTPTDVMLALRQQEAFDREDRLLREQHQKLKSSAPAVFNCGICMDDTPDYMIARPNPCQHEFCRECIRGYIQSKIAEHRFPIVCPLCALDRDSPNPSTLDSLFVEQIGLSPKEAESFMELELAAFSTLIHCRGCGGQAFVDKEEYQEARIVACPIPGCRYAWCKSCSQPIEIGGVNHSCDGTTELAHLMNSKGWKYCPGCKTPTEKSSGCNHMTCMSPGCNMHFCYVCGEAIVQSARRQDISQEVSAHYRRCRLFEDVPDHPARGRR